MKRTRKDLVYPELSYKIVGCLFEAYKKLGAGRREHIYQRAVAEEFKLKNISFKEQAYFPVSYNKTHIGKEYLDFLIEEKIILEIKKGEYFKKQSLDQVLDYLKSTGLVLGIIANFHRSGVKFYRVLNIN